MGAHGGTLWHRRPQKLLALEGGGIRGVLTPEILAEIEQQIHDATGITRFDDYFDYIGGKMDVVEQMDNLRKIEAAVAKPEVNVKRHFSFFIPKR